MIDFRLGLKYSGDPSVRQVNMDITENNSVGGDDLPQQYQALRELGDQYASVGDYAHAQRCYEKAALLEPDESEPYVGLGTIALENKRLEDAEAAFKAAVKLDKGCTKAYCGLGLVYQRKEDSAEAFQMYLKCLESDTGNLTALLGLFQTSCQIGSFSKVRHYLEVYLKIHPGDMKVMFCLATLYMKDSQLNEAKKVLLEVLASEPDYTGAVDLLEEVEHKLSNRS